MQMMELPANIDLGNVEEGPVATSILANMPVEIQVPQTTDTIMKQQDLLLLQIMSTWPEDEDADKWDDRMDAFLAEICSIEEDLTYPLLEWKHTFERLKPQARISLEVMEQQAPVQLRSLPRETKATDTIKNKKNKKKKIKKEPIKQSRAAPPSKSKEPAKAITRKSSRAAEPIYEVDRILGVKRNRKGDVLGYKVSWKGYDASHNSIVSAADAVGCDRLIREYLARTS
jgi:dGTP triphosphohydrolase